MKRDPALVAIDRPPAQALVEVHSVTVERTLRARVSATRRLDHDDVGAEVGENLAAKERPFVRKIQHAVWREHIVSSRQNCCGILPDEPWPAAIADAYAR